MTNQPYTWAKSLGMPFGTWYTKRSTQSSSVPTSARPLPETPEDYDAAKPPLHEQERQGYEPPMTW